MFGLAALLAVVLAAWSRAARARRQRDGGDVELPRRAERRRPDRARAARRRSPTSDGTLHLTWSGRRRRPRRRLRRRAVPAHRRRPAWSATSARRRRTSTRTATPASRSRRPPTPARPRSGRRSPPGRPCEWHDHRTHWMDVTPPPVVQADPSGTHVIIDHWQVPLDRRRSRGDDRRPAAVGAAAEHRAVVAACRRGRRRAARPAVHPLVARRSPSVAAAVGTRGVHRRRLRLPGAPTPPRRRCRGCGRSAGRSSPPG